MVKVLQNIRCTFKGGGVSDVGYGWSSMQHLLVLVRGGCVNMQENASVELVHDGNFFR